jgi:hypothetical protein
LAVQLAGFRQKRYVASSDVKGFFLALVGHTTQAFVTIKVSQSRFSASNLASEMGRRLEEQKN